METAFMVLYLVQAQMNIRPRGPQRRTNIFNHVMVADLCITEYKSTSF